MVSLILAVKPKYIDLILSGEKTQEFRRTGPKDLFYFSIAYSLASNLGWLRIHRTHIIDFLYFYETQRRKKIVAVAEVIDTLYRKKEGQNNRTHLLWDEVKDHKPGIAEEDFKNYFKGNRAFIDYRLGLVTDFKNHPMDLDDFRLKRAPQSWGYVKGIDWCGERYASICENCGAPLISLGAVAPYCAYCFERNQVKLQSIYKASGGGIKK